MRQSDLYETARYQVGTEESLERKYRLEPAPEILQRHTEAADQVVSSLQAARLHSTPAQQQHIDTILALHRQYLDATHQGLFSAVDAGDTVLQLQIDHQLVDPLFAQMETQVTQAAESHHAEALALLGRLTQLQDQLVTLTPLVFMMGMTALAFVWQRMRRVHTTVDRTNQETILRLATQAVTDSLTSLGNHRAFQEVLKEAMRGAVSAEVGFTLVRIDLDEFKLFSDDHGHLFGDQMLADFGCMLRELFPEGAYRVGGDEFSALLPGSLSTATARMQVLCHEVQRRHNVTVSAGVAAYARSITSPEDLQQQADQALYEAKRQGRNRVLTFDEMAGRAVLLLQDQVEALRQVLRDGQMEIAFQPIWHAGGDRLLAYEALARPPRPLGFQGPQELFDVAARLNHSVDLDMLCWTAELARAGALNLPEGTLLFLNLTPQTLDQGEPLAPHLLRRFALLA